MHFPDAFPASQRRYLEIGTRNAVRRAHAVIGVSQSTCDDVVRTFGVDPGRVFPTRLGVDPRFRPLQPETVEEAARRYGLDGSSLLYVGTLEPRKNIPRVLQAFDLTRRRIGSDCRLVLAGGKGWYYDGIFKMVEDLKLHESVHFAGYVPSEDLPALYCAATAFVYPSMYEGFGLPPLEAMACGTPVITSNTSSLPEVVGNDALTVDPYNVQEIADAMCRILSDPDLRCELRSRSIERARRYTWRETAVSTLRAYEYAVERARKP
jgi:glycosyltransferase involved in cell wall biosynthesis